MRLTLHTDFALRVPIQVGLNDGALATISDIAKGFGISKNHLMKVVHDSQKGYLDTVLGLRGALRSATNAFLNVLDGYTLADLIRPHKALPALLFDERISARAG